MLFKDGYFFPAHWANVQPKNKINNVHPTTKITIRHPYPPAHLHICTKTPGVEQYTTNPRFRKVRDTLHYYRVDWRTRVFRRGWGVFAIDPLPIMPTRGFDDIVPRRKSKNYFLRNFCFNAQVGNFLQGHGAVLSPGKGLKFESRYNRSWEQIVYLPSLDSCLKHCNHNAWTWYYAMYVSHATFVLYDLTKTTGKNR